MSDSPPSHDCLVLALGQSTKLSIYHAGTTLGDDAVYPNLFSLNTDGPALNATPERSLFVAASSLAKQKVYRREEWRRRQRFPPLISAPRWTLGSHAPSDKPGSSRLLNGNQEASTTTPNSLLKSS